MTNCVLSSDRHISKSYEVLNLDITLSYLHSIYTHVCLYMLNKAHYASYYFSFLSFSSSVILQETDGSNSNYYSQRKIGASLFRRETIRALNRTGILAIIPELKSYAYSQAMCTKCTLYYQSRTKFTCMFIKKLHYQIPGKYEM